MNSLALLIRSSPNWVEVQEQSFDAAGIVATPPLQGGKQPKTFFLRLRPSSRGGVAVYEQASSRQCPGFCPERHINPDSSFCVFYGSEERISDTGCAETWWSHLAQFLECQVFAEKRGVWPLRSGLSHGDAADHQIAMENIADNHGWGDEILEGIFRRRGWLADRLPPASKDKKMVLNSRTPCPRGCRWKHKLLRKRSCQIEACFVGCGRQHKPILRADCPNRRSVEDIVLHEHKRRKIEQDAIKHFFQKGHRCCGTMQHCPLRDLEEAA